MKGNNFASLENQVYSLTLLHSERPKLHTILAFPSAIGLRTDFTPPSSRVDILRREVKKVIFPESVPMRLKNHIAAPDLCEIALIAQHQ